MKTYYVKVIETLKKKVIVEADSEEEAIAKVEAAYNDCDIILDASDFTGVKSKIAKIVDEDENE